MIAGRDFAHADATANVALADPGYATANKLETGSTVPIGATNFKIVGIVTSSGCWSACGASGT